MNKTSIIRTAIITSGIVAVLTTYDLTRDPLAQQLAVCGDTPAPVEPDQASYALAVKSVDECRRLVLEHFHGG